MPRPGCFYVYMLTNRGRSVIYTGVTNDLANRLRQHREGRGSIFVLKYKAFLLVYFERHESIVQAIRREKQIKAGSRRMKEGLIAERNPLWHDLSETFEYC